ncbi:MAG TPA: hypothetical protein VHY20_02710, partial [Pirellulales bacterium]|nr:hypothetical protein [Pirellulales bacterium]
TLAATVTSAPVQNSTKSRFRFHTIADNPGDVGDGTAFYTPHDRPMTSKKISDTRARGAGYSLVRFAKRMNAGRPSGGRTGGNTPCSQVIRNESRNNNGEAAGEPLF